MLQAMSALDPDRREIQEKRDRLIALAMDLLDHGPEGFAALHSAVDAARRYSESPRRHLTLASNSATPWTAPAAQPAQHAVGPAPHKHAPPRGSGSPHGAPRAIRRRPKNS
jgi:hypothetical protein